ncbi:MAG: outer membrane protein assembly factor BamD [Verrucomicrobiota bacterium]|jgi:outer membrane assembly lipoprotein YfiO
MNRAVFRACVLAMALFAFVLPCPAPLIFTPGEGWHYEKVGETGSWTRGRAKDQLEVAQQSFDKQDYSIAAKAARRTVNLWPFSDYAPQAQYLLARCYEAKGEDERAFNAYQTLITQYPKVPNYDEIILRQMAIANRFLAGQGFKLFNLIPWFASMEKTIKLYEKILKNGPYSEVAPQAQINIGVAHERKFFKELPEAAKAYERAADKYSEQKEGTDALYRVGETYYKQAKKAEYDQSIAGQAIATYSDFVTLHPDDKRVPQAQKRMETLKLEQARGSLEVARYYEKHKKWKAAKIYYNEVNEVLREQPDATLAVEARGRIEHISKLHPESTQ